MDSHHVSPPLSYIILLTITCITLLRFIQLAYLLTYIPPAPNSLQLWTPFPAFLAGAYINAILALLNNRVADRDYGTGVWEEDLVAYVNAGGALGYGEQEGGALGITDRDRIEKGERSVTMGARDILNASSNEKARYGGRERDRSGVLEEGEGDVPPTPGSATMLLARVRLTFIIDHHPFFVRRLIVLLS